MSKSNDGGPAFPLGDNAAGPTSPGMSLRDYFAAAALQGLLAQGADHLQCINVDPVKLPGQKRSMTDEEFTSYVWHIADAMLRAREAK